MPHIFGLPTINILEAFGLSALITFLSPQQIKFNKKPKIDNDKVNQELENIFTDFKSHFDAWYYLYSKLGAINVRLRVDERNT